MDNNIIMRSMLEAFEIIKDSWPIKKDSIIRCIVETEVIDGNLAMDMWRYILEKNLILLKDKNENAHFVDDVILGFNAKYESHPTPVNMCKTIYNHIAKHLVQNDNLIKILFGNLINAGYSGQHYWVESEPSEPIPALLACMISQNCARSIPVFMKSISGNVKMEDISLGELLLKSNYYLDGITIRWSSSHFYLSDDVKGNLLNCLDLISDKNDRAEIALSLMGR